MKLLAPVVLVASVLLTLHANAQSSPPAAGSEGAASAAPSPTAPKKRVAVMKFDGGEMATQTGTDLGSALAAQLTTALVQSGQFVVVERGELVSVLREQELGAQRLTTSDTSARLGRLLGAQLLVRAAVTEFSQKAGGGGFRVGVASGLLGSVLGTSSSTAVVGIDVRLIDTTTGQVVLSRRAESQIEDRAVSADLGVRNVNFGADSFEKTPLGRAAREAIEKAVDIIVASSRPIAWTGRVVEDSGEQLFINAGSDQGLKKGDRFVVSTVLRELTDPSTGTVLDVIEAPLGEIELLSVRPAVSIARKSVAFPSKRGDLVRVAAP